MCEIVCVCVCVCIVRSQEKEEGEAVSLGRPSEKRSAGWTSISGVAAIHCGTCAAARARLAGGPSAIVRLLETEGGRG